MRRILAVSAFLIAAGPASAQTDQQYSDWCYGAKSTDAQTMIGCTVLIASGRFSGADLSALYNNRGTSYDESTDLDMKIDDETRAVQLNSANAEAFNNRCAAYNTKKLFDQAKADCDQAISLKPGYAHAYYNRGVAYENKASRDLAIADYRAAAKFDPSYTRPTDALKRLGVTGPNSP